MSVHVGINGFGRIGRLLLRLGLEDPALDFCAINDPGMSPDYMAYLLKYDTIHGRFSGEVGHDEKHLIVNGRAIRVFDARDPGEIPWAQVQARYVLESSGLFTKLQGAGGHLTAGAKKVLITAPSSDAPMFVSGVNQHRYTPDMTIVSNASCTTNALAPIAKVLQDTFGIRSGLMTTVHSTTATQRTVDGPSKKDWRGGRAASANIIPSATGAAKAVGKVIPELDGRLTGMAFRVPTLDASVLDLTVNLARDASYADVCAALQQAADGPLKGILACTKAPLVSSDFIGDRHASVFDSDAGMGLEGGFVKLVAWYDNEAGYSAMVLRLLRHMAQVDGVL